MLRKRLPLLAHYPFTDPEQPGLDASGNGYHATLAGNRLPETAQLDGRTALQLHGGPSGNSYLELPSSLLASAGDHTGLTVSAWLRLGSGLNVWERFFDFGAGPAAPSLFVTRQLRTALAADGDLLADPGRSFPRGEWMHVALSLSGTAGGTMSAAGPVVYVNGEVVADGTISQTSSGQYARLRRWFDAFESLTSGKGEKPRLYIGRSQYDADDDLSGAIADFRVYVAPLGSGDIIDQMCESLSGDEVVRLAAGKYLSLPTDTFTRDTDLPRSLMGGKVEVTWMSSDPEALSTEGRLWPGGTPSGPRAVTLTAVLNCGSGRLERSFAVTALPPELPPYTMTIHGQGPATAVSEAMYGLFYEDINNAADGGIYAELIRNRSFEAFEFDTYSHASGACGCSTGRNRRPLLGWYGDLGSVKPQTENSLGEHLGSPDPEANRCYVTVADGATLRNRGFNDTNDGYALAVKEGECYDFSIWAKSEIGGTITVSLRDAGDAAVSNSVVVQVEGGGIWRKYGFPYPGDQEAPAGIVLTGTKTLLGELALTFEGDISVDMVSLMPRSVWGRDEEAGSATAHANYAGNPNYRLRRDLVEALAALSPAFFRFPGGCISEGSFIWDNVYDWKDSVGAAELRKENFNVWGYMMTMGLGYMEYFQLAEDLGALPLPVMACGVLCQARSDYAHPAGGKLRDYYVKSFTDLIDFAVGTDFEGNEWAALRRRMGHEAPFDLRYLGVGNENWGPEFYANFEYFKARIDAYMEQHYPGRELHIISTVGAQADDDAYQQGWAFLSGRLKGTAKVAFADGTEITEETVSWYSDRPDYMDTIADEHYYRSNEYLLENADRYNYYYRAYRPDGSLDEFKTSKVFVGEYASTDKNTLAGAIAEAAAMTGFENNADVVRLAAYAPLFNKVLTDGSYRWTPDCIWFDDETVWFTPNYYVQQLFASHLGDKVLPSSFTTYRNGSKQRLAPRGGIELAAGAVEVTVRSVRVISNRSGEILLEQDFVKLAGQGSASPGMNGPLSPLWQTIPGSAGYTLQPGRGLVLAPQASGHCGIYLMNGEWSDYTVTVEASKGPGEDGFYVGVGLTEIAPECKDVLEYAIGYGGKATGVKVFKRGVEGYTLGDYATSTAAGNLRAACHEPLSEDTVYTLTVNFGGDDGRRLLCSHACAGWNSLVLDYKLEAYNRDIYHSVTADAGHVYIKLVNPSGSGKRLLLNLESLPVESPGRWMLLTGDDSLVHTPNVNTKEREPVSPVACNIKLETAEPHNGGTDIQRTVLDLPAYSVNVLVLKRNGGINL